MKYTPRFLGILLALSLSLGFLVADDSLDGVYRVDGHPFIRRAAFGAVNTFKNGYFLQLPMGEIGGDKDLYTKSGLNTLVYNCRVEKKGDYNFEAMDDLLKRAEAAHMKVLLHIPQSLPAWLVKERDWHWIGQDGSKIVNSKGYPHHNPEEYAMALKEVWQPVIEHIRENPTVIGYQISGEHHPYDSASVRKTGISYDDWTISRYRSYLKSKFTLEELSQRYFGKPDAYHSFDDVFPPAEKDTDFAKRKLVNPIVARWDWYRFKKTASVDSWVAMVKAFQSMDGHHRSINYEYNHGPYSDIRFFPLHAAAAGAPGFGLGNGDFSDSLEGTFLYAGFIKTIGGAPWINNELEVGWTGSFKNEPTDIDAAYIRRHLWWNLALGSQGYNLWTFPNLANYIPDNALNLSKLMENPDFSKKLPLKYWELKHSNQMIESLGEVLAGSKAPLTDIGVFMLDDSSFNWMYTESYNVDVLGLFHAFCERGLIDHAGIYTEYQLDLPDFDLNKLRAIIIPRTPRMTEAHMARLADYVRNGGNLFLMGEVAGVGESFNKYPAFPSGPLAEAAGIQAHALPAEQLRERPLQAETKSGLKFLLNAQVAIQEPLGSYVTVLATAGTNPVITSHPYGKGRCFYVAGDFIVPKNDRSSTADVVAGLMDQVNCKAAASLTENGNPSSGAYVSRRVGPNGTLLFLIETGNRNHNLEVKLQPDVLGLDTRKQYRVFECFSNDASTVSEANGWTVKCQLEPVGVRCLLVTESPVLDALIPKDKRIIIPREENKPLFKNGPWNVTLNTQRSYLTGDAQRENSDRLAAESLAAAKTSGSWQDLGGGFTGMSLNQVGNKTIDTFTTATQSKLPSPKRETDTKKQLSIQGNVPALVESKILSVERAIRNLPVNAQVHSLHFFHGGHFSEHDSTVGTYEIHYADGTLEQVPVIVQSTISDFTRRGLRPSHSSIAGRVEKGGHFQGLISRYDWVNPYPEKIVESIDIINDAETKERTWDVFAITMKKK
jgi:hypothetical protein